MEKSGQEYVTIAEFAEMTGRSKQAIYKRIGQDLGPYILIENGKKLLSTAALELFEDRGDGISAAAYNQAVQERDTRIAELERERDGLKEQLSQAREQNQQLMERLAEQNQIVMATQKTLMTTQATLQSALAGPQHRLSWRERLFGSRKQDQPDEQINNQ